jgi:Tfp pilus assembly protein PilN
MNAVNLIPAEARRGLGSSGSGLASYVVLGVLALVVAMSAVNTLANRSLTDKRDALSTLQQRAQTYQAQAKALESYTTFAGLREKRSETVRSLATSRFDWSKTLHEVARTIPSDAWLTSMRGTVSPNTPVDGGRAGAGDRRLHDEPGQGGGRHLEPSPHRWRPAREPLLVGQGRQQLRRRRGRWRRRRRRR